jgi:hypothetical protein
MQDDNIKIDFRKLGSDNANWINLTTEKVRWTAVVNNSINCMFPEGGEFLSLDN